MVLKASHGCVRGLMGVFLVTHRLLCLLAPLMGRPLGACGLDLDLDLGCVCSSVSLGTAQFLQVQVFASSGLLTLQCVPMLLP